MLRRVALLGIALTTLTAAAPQHGLALHSAPHYPPDFAHLDYVNPQAPKGGTVRLAAMGTFDTLNPFTLKGIAATGAGLVFATLMEKSADEPFSQYGQIAVSVTLADDKTWVEYRLRDGAKFHDGKPITPADVIFSFRILRDKGHPHYRSYYRDVSDAVQTGPATVRFTLAAPDNAELPLILGELPVLPAHAWDGRDFTATTLTPLVGSGPYRVKAAEAGRRVIYERINNWWGQDLAINRGRYNYDQIIFDYYRDPTVALEAFFAGRYDFRLENVAKNWATAYTSPAVKDGRILRQEIKSSVPAGMQAFVFNTRRPLFKDARVRLALNLAFDFEWANKNIAFGAYKRSPSYFTNSEMAATGLPDAAELALLEPYRAQLPDAVFANASAPPVTDGSGNPRANLRRAAELLREAGWTMRDGQLVDATGNHFVFTVVDESPAFDRWTQPWLRNLERLGIKADFRLVDSAQYQSLMDNFDFDVTIAVFPQSLSPGNEQRDFWSSAKADIKGGRNLIGVRDPVVDALVNNITNAQDRTALITACRALDRVLRAGHYVVPHWHTDSFRVAFWDIFGRPPTNPKYDVGYLDTWWIDAAKATTLKRVPGP